MAKSPNPFFDLDVTKVMGEFDPSKMAQEFTKMAEKYKMPGVDVDAIVNSQRKNLEAVTAANKTAVEGLQAVAMRQAEILQSTMDAVASAVDQLSKSGSPQEAAAKQAEIAKSAFEKALADVKEVAEMVAKSNQDAAAAINSRISESLEEIQKIAKSIK